MRILRVCLDEARTNKEIADILGRDPATVLHHVRTLVGTGFLTSQTPRRSVRGAREIPYLATGKSWRIEALTVGPIMIQAFVEEAGLVPPGQVLSTRLGLRLTESEVAELEQRLGALFEEYLHRHPAADATAWSMFWSLHPDPNRTPPTSD